MSNVEKAEILIKRANITLTNHKATRMFAPFIVAGSWSVEADPFKCPTAYTDGKHEVYGADFVVGLANEKQVRFLVMHENGHEFLMHIQRRSPEMKQDPDTWGQAIDYVINGMLVRIANEYPELLEMIPSALYDAKYDGWSVQQVFNDIKQDKNRNGKGRKPMDKHDTSNADESTPEQVKADAERILQDLQQGAMMAGVIGDSVPQEIGAALAPQIDWLAVMQEYLTEISNGRDDLTLARYDRRYVADDLFYPDVESESLGEIVLGFDMSGSTVGPEADKMMAALKDFCIKTQPQRLRVLWWDTQVNAEQVFDSTTYDNITNLAKPVGGGGTRAGCVSDYITDRNLQPDAVLIFTDGYTEHDIKWQVKAPTLWMVTQNREFKAPAGRSVNTFN